MLPTPLIQLSFQLSIVYAHRSFLWDDFSSDVFSVNASTAAVGFTKIPGAVGGGYGRKIYIRGAQNGTGCFFSTDYK